MAILCSVRVKSFSFTARRDVSVYWMASCARWSLFSSSTSSAIHLLRLSRVLPYQLLDLNTGICRCISIAQGILPLFLQFNCTRHQYLACLFIQYSCKGLVTLFDCQSSVIDPWEMGYLWWYHFISHLLSGLTEQQVPLWQLLQLLHPQGQTHKAPVTLPNSSHW